jgi:prepilin-type processing-associated H-X9-DG protein
MGDSNRNPGFSQPGGWIYQSLPYIEQANLYNMGGTPASRGQMAAVALPMLNCPTRRNGGPYPGVTSYVNATGITQMAKVDYACNSGDQQQDEIYPGPASYAQGDDPTYAWPATAQFTGVIYQRSSIPLLNIPNGTSNTFLLGEKYLNPSNYATGADPSDNENPYVGFDNDISRDTSSPPMQDLRGYQNTLIFGSAHSAGVNMVYCDGSVSLINYSIDPNVFKRAGNRN